MNIFSLLSSIALSWENVFGAAGVPHSIADAFNLMAYEENYPEWVDAPRSASEG